MSARAVEDFRLGGPVYSSDGRLVGEVHRTLVGAEDFKLQAIVVEEDREFSGAAARGTARMIPDVVIPIEGIAAATNDRVDLSLTAADVRRLPPYITYRQAPLSASEQVSGVLTVLGGNPVVPRMEEVTSRRDNEIEIDAGENVMLGRTGRKLGEVKEVLFDGPELVGIVMQPDGFFRHPVILPRRFLERSDDLALFAQLTDVDLERLEPL
jgi:sporulation protein YlmC with PRC-barrel domain